MKKTILFILQILSFASFQLLSPVALGYGLKIELGGSSENFKYSEVLVEPSKSTETATVNQALLGLRYEFNPHSWLQVRGIGVRGVQSQYDGSDLTTNEPVTAMNPMGFTNYEALLYIPISSAFRIHVGYGTRNWDRFLSGNPGYREIYSWNYAAYGLDILLLNHPTSQLRLEYSARPTSSGKIKVITSKTIPDGADSEMELGARTGFRVSIPYALQLSNHVGLNITPFYEKSEIGESEVVANSTLAPTTGTGISEPSSTTLRSGAELALLIGF